MNSSLKTADRTTHLKIVVVSLVASIAIVVIGITAHTVPSGSAGPNLQFDRMVVKAEKPIHLSRRDSNLIR